MSEKKPGLREKKKQQIREAILECGERMFSERGFAGVEVKHILEEVEISQPTFYRYFETKAHLYLEVLEKSGVDYNVVDALQTIVGDGAAKLLLTHLRAA